MTFFAIRVVGTDILYNDKLVYRKKAPRSPKIYTKVGFARAKLTSLKGVQEWRVKRAAEDIAYFKKHNTPEEYERKVVEGWIVEDNFKPLEFEIIEFEMKIVGVREKTRAEEYKKTVLALESLQNDRRV